jgi:hypothetical protein
MPKILDIKDMRFGRLLVIERTKVSGARNVMWRCLCDCGNKTIAAAANIGKTTFSCGCLAKETAKELLSGNTYARTHNIEESIRGRQSAPPSKRLFENSIVSITAKPSAALRWGLAVLRSSLATRSAFSFPRYWPTAAVFGSAPPKTRRRSDHPSRRRSP